MPKLNKNKKKTDASELPGVVEEDKRSRILKTVEATERFIPLFLHRYGSCTDDGSHTFNG